MTGDALLLIEEAQRLLRAGRRREALGVALRAGELKVASASFEDSLGALLTHLEEPALALPMFERAVARSPGNVDFRYNLAMAQRMTGDLAAAEANLDEVLSVRHGDGESYLTRSQLRRQTPARNHVAQLESALRRMRGRRSAIAVEFALAKELEDLGEYARSFAHLETACRSFRASLRYDVAGDIAVIDALCEIHHAAAICGLKSGYENREAIFIVGLPRTGTTLVERILGSHGAVQAAGELDAFPRVVVQAVSALASAAAGKRAFVDSALKVDMAALGPAYIEATRPRTGGKHRFTDKLPINYLYAGLIHAALPRARFIAVHRNPADACYAMYKTLFATAYPFSYDLSELAHYYVAWERLMRHWQNVVGDAWLRIDYEDLVRDQERVSRSLVAHCGLDWDPRCLDFHTQSAAVTTASAAQVRRPLNADSVGQWKHYAAQLAPLLRDLEANGIPAA